MHLSQDGTQLKKKSMSVKVEFSVSGIDQDLDEAINLVNDSSLLTSNEIASLALSEQMKNWYGEKGNGYWSNPSGPTHGAGRRKSGWHDGLKNWLPQKATATMGGAYFEGEKYGLAMKIKGGQITAKNSQYLTIPVAPEAHGLRVADYTREYNKLFRPKNKNYLAEQVQGKGIRVVYALKKSVNLNPWPNAIPSNEWIAEVYFAAFTDELFQNHL